MIEKNELKNIKVYSLTDEMKAIIFAVQKLLKQYPNNKGKVYLSNISTFFKNKKNVNIINEQLGFLPVYTPEIIEQIIDKLVDMDIVTKHIGTRFAVSVFLNDNLFEEHIHRNDYIITDLDLRAIVYAIRCLRIQYPKNEGKVYISNINTFFKATTSSSTFS